MAKIAVAPLVGAWIEIYRNMSYFTLVQSLPSWERGLKCKWLIKTGWTIESLPSWERGLKSYLYVNFSRMLGRSPRGSVD